MLEDIRIYLYLYLYLFDRHSFSFDYHLFLLTTYTHPLSLPGHLYSLAVDTRIPQSFHLRCARLRHTLTYILLSIQQHSNEGYVEGKNSVGSSFSRWEITSMESHEGGVNEIIVSDVQERKSARYSSIAGKHGEGPSSLGDICDTTTLPTLCFISSLHYTVSSGTPDARTHYETHPLNPQAERSRPIRNIKEWTRSDDSKEVKPPCAPPAVGHSAHHGPWNPIFAMEDSTARGVTPTTQQCKFLCSREVLLTFDWPIVLPKYRHH
ncbi:uncharacterized protein BT62DRAFT_1009222 [Guyanagaster necrorhizus]|uniref:Uncharacterized protein n=1 Tax=Guyanagaster necrorhizus TaxID=856835 RepID=A0A9P7VMY2_9AGAR|nr:uncharacterized protein BT62DRAFT_1009222 [Guyanagaster necrorhizus MCA 3950]KAG7443412.1 hypothetical protein BT62DRAFT_1009222 [Guyanagaster necrorhizus MCA 3950]